MVLKANLLLSILGLALGGLFAPSASAQEAVSYTHLTLPTTILV